MTVRGGAGGGVLFVVIVVVIVVTFIVCVSLPFFPLHACNITQFLPLKNKTLVV